ncbi:hypothetical protein AJ79_05824 [Helicocarpus griseus UAMH5409]|uniref:LIM zinc-binding domain-containing protein n=1 Tax=Helicocarpus griseus UAMH5409 TaxID=1447875 RepID=A0A2B7XIR7_9EURO|nr:hypothetical protein AJ79_05824 [Helicocarpus griseus UAMH5409]
MEADLDGLLPVIKCSNCNASVGISEMGDHVCARPSQQLTPPPDQDSHNKTAFDSPPNPVGFSRDGKSGRLGPPPRIDPFAANRPFLQPNLLTPANSDGGPSLAPSPLKRSQTTPLPPTPEQANEDGSYTPFVRSHTVSGSALRSRYRMQQQTPNIETTPYTSKPFDTSPDRGDEDDRNDLDSNNPSILRSPASDEEDRGRPRSNPKHRREMSIDSKTFLRMSEASSRYDSGLSPYPPRKLSNSGRNVMDEIPPLPTGPIKSFTPSPYDAIPSSYRFESKEEYEQDRITGTSPPKDEPKKEIFGSFDFGLPSQPKLPRNSDEGVHLRQPSNATTSSSISFRPPVPEKDKHIEPIPEGPKSPEYRIDEEFSVSNFARDLGLNHSANPSISSTGTAPSDMASGSSFSSRPSEVSSEVHRKPSGSANVFSGSDYSLDVEPVRPGDPYAHVMDSPTDPSYQNGHLLSGMQKSDRFNDSNTEQSLPSLPPQPLARKVTPPPRTATRTPTGRRSRCRGCQEIIVGKSISSADGRLTGRWHKGCFVCQTCNSPFLTADFYVLRNLPYCSQHYHELNGSLCGSCHRGIEGQYLETEEENEDFRGGTRKKYHPNCFTCRTCNVVLRGDYFEWNGVAYCEYDGRAAAAAMYPPPSPRMMPPGPGYRRPPYGVPRGYPGGYGPGPGPPGPRYGPGGPGMRYPPSSPSLSVPDNRGMNNRRYPERRTTRLMMI